MLDKVLFRLYEAVEEDYEYTIWIRNVFDWGRFALGLFIVASAISIAWYATPLNLFVGVVGTIITFIGGFVMTGAWREEMSGLRVDRPIYDQTRIIFTWERLNMGWGCGTPILAAILYFLVTLFMA